MCQAGFQNCGFPDAPMTVACVRRSQKWGTLGFHRTSFHVVRRRPSLASTTLGLKLARIEKVQHCSRRAGTGERGTYVAVTCAPAIAAVAAAAPRSTAHGPVSCRAASRRPGDAAARRITLAAVRKLHQPAAEVGRCCCCCAEVRVADSPLPSPKRALVVVSAAMWPVSNRPRSSPLQAGMSDRLVSVSVGAEPAALSPEVATGSCCRVRGRHCPCSPERFAENRQCRPRQGHLQQPRDQRCSSRAAVLPAMSSARAAGIVSALAAVLASSSAVDPLQQHCSQSRPAEQPAAQP